MNRDGSITAQVDVTNSGKIDGKEVVQPYLYDHHASATRPTRELKGFELIELKAETKPSNLKSTKND